MDWEVYYLLAVIVIAIYLFITEKVALDITALLIAVALMGAGIVTVQEGLSGFSNQAALAILALLILNVGLERTGLIAIITDQLVKYTGSKTWSILLVILPFAAVLSAFINNTVVITMFLPILIKMGDQKQISASKLIMPLAFVCILGGMCTLIGTSTNLLINTIARQYGITPFTFFEFSKIGGVLAVIGILYGVFIAPRIIPARRHTQKLKEEFEIKQYVTAISIPAGSNLIGDMQKAIDFLKKVNIKIITITSKFGRQYRPKTYNVIKEGDSILIKTSLDNILKLESSKDFLFASKTGEDRITLNNLKTTLVESLISPTSSLIGKRLDDVEFLRKYGAIPIAVNHTRKKLRKGFAFNKLEFGDTLLLEATSDINDNEHAKNDLILLNNIQKTSSVRKQLIAFFTIIGVIVTAAIGLVPIVVSALAGVTVLALTGCLDSNLAYKRIEWKVYFLIAGLIPLGIAIQNTGIDKLIATTFVTVTASLDTLPIIMILFFFTVLITNVLANNATALLMGPIAVSIANQLNIDPHALLLAVLFGSSTSFFTPVGYHTLTLIYAPGKYRFRDYMRAGLPLTLIIGFTTSFLIYRMYGN